MRRTYALDVLVCSRCAGPMRVIALIEDERVARRILAHLGLATTTPTFKPARDPPQMQLAWGECDGVDVEPDYAGDDPIPDDLN